MHRSAPCLAAALLALAAAPPATARSLHDAPAAAHAAAADTPLPATAAGLAAFYTTTTRALHAAVDDWRTTGDPATGQAPGEVQRLAIDQQRVGRRLGRDRELATRTLARVPARLRTALREDVLARRDLTSIRSVVVQRPRIRLGSPAPADELRAHYRAAWRRFGVGFPLLAAVNFVESAFGKVRNESTSGAQGPMQFMPATWAAFGLGGDVNDPRDAILGAANYLRANGAPRAEARALLRYNPSRHYVSAIRRYARLIRADERAFYVFYARAVYIGGRRRTGPGM